MDLYAAFNEANLFAAGTILLVILLALAVLWYENAPN